MTTDTTEHRKADAKAESPAPSQETGQRSPLVRWRTSSANFRASIILLTALVAFTAMTVFIKLAGQTMPLVQILMIRQVIMQILILPFIVRDFPNVLITGRPGLQIFRGLLQLGAMVLSFAAVIHLPLAHAMAISFSYGIFVTIGAGVFLGETVGRGRWIATALGLVGVGLMLRPSGDASVLYSVVAVFGAVFAAASAISVRHRPTAGGAHTVLTYQALVLLSALAIPAALTWVTPTFDQWMLLLLVGVTGTIGQWMLTVAYQTGDAAALAPLDFVRLLLTVAVGFVLFGDSLDAWLLAGGLILVGSVAYTLRTNGRRVA